MEAVLTKAIAFVAIIILGYVLKKVGLFRAKDFYLISVIVMKITLPAAIVSNFSKITLDFSLLILCVIGFG
ncbi:MAG: AEC family transporter, partial [Hungatella sp.]